MDIYEPEDAHALIEQCKQKMIEDQKRREYEKTDEYKRYKQELDARLETERQRRQEEARREQEYRNSLKKVGFWNLDQDEEKIKKYILSLIVEGWNETNEATTVIEYMKAGSKLCQYKGWATHRLNGEKLGTCDMECPNKKWIYPELWWRYIETHSVKPDNEKFIQDAVKWQIKHKK